jgi:hypothetical protein
MKFSAIWKARLWLARSILWKDEDLGLTIELQA